MEKLKIEKEQMRKEIEAHFKKSAGFFVTSYAGLSVEKLSELRNQLAGAHGDYLVVKNNIAKRALEECKIADVSALIEGPCGLGFIPGAKTGGKDDPVSIAKLLVAFSKANEPFKLKGGYLDGAVVSQDVIKALASLPSREVLIAKAVGSMKAPLYQMVNVLSGTLRKLVYALNAIKSKKSEDRSQKTDKEGEGVKNG